MPTEYWYPVSATPHDLPSGFDLWAAGGSSSVNKNANARVGGERTGPPTHDDDVSYIRRTWSSGTENQALNVDWPGPMAALGSTFNANFRHRVGGSTRRGARFINAAGSGGSNWGDVTDSAAAYANTGPVDVSNGATYRPGGGAWAPTDFGDDKTIFQDVFATSGDAIITSIWGQLEYTPPPGAFVYLLGLATPLVAAHLASWSDFVRFLTWRRLHHPRHSVLSREETRRAWREYREHRFPRHFDLAGA